MISAPLKVLKKKNWSNHSQMVDKELSMCFYVRWLFPRLSRQFGLQSGAHEISSNCQKHSHGQLLLINQLKIKNLVNRKKIKVDSGTEFNSCTRFVDIQQLDFPNPVFHNSFLEFSLFFCVFVESQTDSCHVEISALFWP